MKTELRVIAFGNSSDFRRTQILRKVWILFGFVIFWKEVDREEVPQFAVIEAGCFGFTNWKSKWSGEEGIYWRQHDGSYIQYEKIINEL